MAPADSFPPWWIVHSGDFLPQVPSAAQDTLWPMSLTEAADVGALSLDSVSPVEPGISTW